MTTTIRAMIFSCAMLAAIAAIIYFDHHPG
jgi:hypothetical protein